MTALLPLLAAIAATPTPPAQLLEVEAGDAVARAFQRVKLSAPARDPSLSLAARSLAERILSNTLEPSRLVQEVPLAVSDAGGWDPAIRTLLVSGSESHALLDRLASQAPLTEEPADVYGVGVASDPGRTVLVLLWGRRYAELAPFPRTAPVGGGGVIEARVRAPLHDPQLVLTGPDGRAETDSDALAEGPRLRARLRFARPGRYALELVARGPDGPRVAALFHVAVGDAGAAAVDDADPPEPRDPIAKSEALLARINRLRARAKVPPLERDPALDVIALDHSEDMAVHHFFAHVSPARGDLHQRLEKARCAYVRAGENLGEAPGALAAERAIESSPAHLENLLDPAFKRVGIGLYPNRHPGGEATLMLTEIFTVPQEQLADPAFSVYAALNGMRAQRHQPVLARDPDLDRVAARHLARMIASGSPGGAGPIEDDALESMPAVDSIAVDVFVGSAPDDALRSRNLFAPAFNRVGVAAATHSGSRFGQGRLWICVLYARVMPRP